MSKSNVQALTLLNVISSSFFFLHAERRFSRVDLSRMCERVYWKSFNMIVDWPDTDGAKDMEAMHRNNIAWQRWIDEQQMGHVDQCATYVYLCSRVLVDLKSRVNPRKKKLLSTLDEPIKRLEEFTDPDGVRFTAYEEGDKMLDKLYEIIRWEW